MIGDEGNSQEMDESRPVRANSLNDVTSQTKDKL